MDKGLPLSPSETSKSYKLCFGRFVAKWQGANSLNFSLCSHISFFTLSPPSVILEQVTAWSWSSTSGKLNWFLCIWLGCVWGGGFAPAGRGEGCELGNREETGGFRPSSRALSQGLLFSPVLLTAALPPVGGPGSRWGRGGGRTEEGWGQLAR